MRLLGVAVALACGACDVVWSVDRVPEPDGDVVRYIAPGDYDGDGKPNETDPCPYIASPAGISDRDRDGVGDDCDPAPDKPGDCFVLFDGFQGELDPRWVADGVSGSTHYPWSVCTDPGSPVFCSPRPSSISWLYFSGGISPPLLRVSMQVWNISDVNPSALGVSTDIASAALDVSGRFCEVTLPDVVAGDTWLGVADRSAGVLVDQTGRVSPLPYSNAQQYVYEWSTMGQCKVSAASAIDTITPTKPASPGGSGIGLRNAHVDVNVAWIAGLGSC